VGYFLCHCVFFVGSLCVMLGFCWVVLGSLCVICVYAGVISDCAWVIWFCLWALLDSPLAIVLSDTPQNQQSTQQHTL